VVVVWFGFENKITNGIAMVEKSQTKNGNIIMAIQSGFKKSNYYQMKESYKTHL
jgi:hypothetical protein